MVSTELPTRSVQRIVGINDTLPTEIPSVPFGLAVASKSRQHRVSLDELSGKLGLEWDFLQGLSLGDILEKLKKRGYSLPVGADTAYDTNTQTTDFCNVSSNYGTQTQSQGVTDDSHNDTEPDTTMDVTIDTVTDYKNDPTPTLPE